MKKVHIPIYLTLLVVLASCSAAYRSGQTPDDVYYSPAPAPETAYVVTDNQRDRESYAYRNEATDEDLAIRRGIRSSRLRSNISFSMGVGSAYGMGFYNPYAYNPYNSYGYLNPYGSGKYGNGFNSFDYYNPYTSGLYYDNYANPFYNNSYYSGLNLSPYYNYYFPQAYYSVSNATPVTRGARMYNMRPYNTNSSARNNSQNRGNIVAPSNAAPVRRTTVAPSPSSNNNNRGVGNAIRRVFVPSDNTNNNNNRSNTRVNRSSPSENTRSYDNSNYTPSRSSSSGSGSSSSSSSSGGSAPTRTFRK